MGWQETTAGLLLALGCWLSLLNWSALFLSWWSGKFHSAIPLVGGFCLGAGALLLPALRPYAWVAVFLDWGTLVVVVSLPWLVREVWATCGFNLMEEYIGVKGRTTVRLRLFRRGWSSSTGTSPARRASTGWSGWAESEPGSGSRTGSSCGWVRTLPYLPQRDMAGRDGRRPSGSRSAGTSPTWPARNFT